MSVHLSRVLYLPVNVRFVICVTGQKARAVRIFVSKKYLLEKTVCC